MKYLLTNSWLFLASILLGITVFIFCSSNFSFIYCLLFSIAVAIFYHLSVAIFLYTTSRAYRLKKFHRIVNGKGSCPKCNGTLWWPQEANLDDPTTFLDIWCENNPKAPIVSSNTNRHCTYHKTF